MGNVFQPNYQSTIISSACLWQHANPASTIMRECFRAYFGELHANFFCIPVPRRVVRAWQGPTCFIIAVLFRHDH
jgi:hypothetical protein